MIVLFNINFFFFFFYFQGQQDGSSGKGAGACLLRGPDAWSLVPGTQVKVGETILQTCPMTVHATV